MAKPIAPLSVFKGLSGAVVYSHEFGVNSYHAEYEDARDHCDLMLQRYSGNYMLFTLDDKDDNSPIWSLT